MQLQQAFLAPVPISNIGAKPAEPLERFASLGEMLFVHRLRVAATNVMQKVGPNPFGRGVVDQLYLSTASYDAVPAAAWSTVEASNVVSICRTYTVDGAPEASPEDPQSVSFNLPASSLLTWINRDRVTLLAL